MYPKSIPVEYKLEHLQRINTFPQITMLLSAWRAAKTNQLNTPNYTRVV